MNNDLISRSALLADLQEYLNQEVTDGMQFTDMGEGIDLAMERAKEAPAVDAVEVVRCRDCIKHYDSKFGYVVCLWFSFIDPEVKKAFRFKKVTVRHHETCPVCGAKRVNLYPYNKQWMCRLCKIAAEKIDSEVLKNEQNNH